MRFARLVRAGDSLPAAKDDTVERPGRQVKSSFSIPLICTTRRRIPVSASTNQGPAKVDLLLL